MADKNNGKAPWYRKLRNKYRLVILNDETYEEKFSFRLSRLNVFVTVGFTILVLITGTIFLIAFTPLREYIPGYTDVTLSRRVNELLARTDSLEQVVYQKTLYLDNIRKIMSGELPGQDSLLTGSSTASIDPSTVEYRRSPEDSILRAEFRREATYDLYYSDQSDERTENSLPYSRLFYTPIEGVVTSEFDIGTGHYGIDLVAKPNEAVRAVLDGTVVFSDWSIETGYTIGIQHSGNFLSVYKHNSVLLKRQGALVKAGEPIAIVGASGELSTGSHLHFELWYNSTPVNPRDYIVFESKI
ncbi:MAG: M23 family metallopeptidase [Bacteroidales bacterium]